MLAATGQLGWPRECYCTDTPPSVMIVPVTADGNLVLVRRYLKARVLEFPAGTVSNGEQAEAAALRELEEETGYAHAHGEASESGFETKQAALVWGRDQEAKVRAGTWNDPAAGE